MNQHNPADRSAADPDEPSNSWSHETAGPPPPPGPPPYGPGGGVQSPFEASPNDPRQDPRWVYMHHDAQDESRAIPYFSGYHPGPDHYYPPRAKRGCLSVVISGAGFIGFAILLVGLLALVFDWDRQSNPLDDFLASPLDTPEDVAPDAPQDSSVDALIQQLDHVHEGIAVDWAAGPYTGTGLDPGQPVSEAPGIFMVDTEVYQYLGFGTGMVVSSNGLAITNYHVVESSMSVSITMADTEQRYSADVLGRDASRDIAVLQIDTDEPLEVSSINPGQVSRGDTVAGVGNAGGQGYLTSVIGEIYATDETIHIEPQEPGSPAQWLQGLIMVTADIVPGYSGGPTVDANGQVIGISTAASQDTTNTDEAFGYAVPITRALEVVEQVLAGDESGDVVIGAGGALGIVVSSEAGGGARVMEVSEGSAGASIGLQPDDILLEIDGHEVVNSSFISRYVRDKSPGDEVEVVWRDTSGALQHATVALDEASIN